VSPHIKNQHFSLLKKVREPYSVLEWFHLFEEEFEGQKEAD